MFKNIKSFFKSTFKKFKGIIAGYSIITLIETGLSVFTPYLLLQFLPSPAASASSEIMALTTTTAVLLGGYGLAWGTNQILPIFRNKLLTPLNAHISDTLSEEVSKKFYSLPLDHQLSAPTGEVSMLITKCYYSIKRFIPSALGKILPVILETFGITALLIILFGPIGSSPLVTLVLYSGSALISSRKIADAQKEELDEGFAFGGQYQAAFNNYENAHYFNNVTLELNNFKRAAGLFSDAIRKSNNLIQNSAIRSTIILGLGFTATMLLSALKVSQGAFSILDFFIINLYTAQFSLRLNSLSSAINKFQAALMDTRKVFEFYNNRVIIAEAPNAPALAVNAQTANIKFKRVVFGYSDKTVLNDVSCDIQAGQKVALVGVSGEGKSTFLKLLFRFYELSKGSIYINNQDISTVTLLSLRASMAVVPQTPNLFNATILENIKYGNRNASDEAIKLAAKLAGLASFIENQPLKYNTRIGEGGAKISGGQKQRIAIARAILKNSPIIIFDEATSSLDVKTEREVQENIDRISKGKTTITVTHRLTTITNADVIFCLKDGKICEQGNYQTLMEKRGFFFQQMDEYCQTLGISIDNIKPQTRNNLAQQTNTSTETKSESETKTLELKIDIDSFPIEPPTTPRSPIVKFDSIRDHKGRVLSSEQISKQISAPLLGKKKSSGCQIL